MIISQLGGYEKFLEFMNNNTNDPTCNSLKQEILEMNREMSRIGIMTMEEWDDPKKRQEFIKRHARVVIGFEKIML
jgi:flagellar motor component MotA